MSANIKQYKAAFDLSQQFIDAAKITKYPIDVPWVLQHRTNRTILISSFADYKRWAIGAGRKCPDELQDAKCYYLPESDLYIIVYNEKKSKKRIRFSLAHELGHIILEHLHDKRTEIDRGGLEDVAYFAMEGAANTFAGNFLAPPILIQERISGKHFDISDIAKFFNISNESVRNYRKRDYQYWLEIPHEPCENRILERCKNSIFPCFCNSCSSSFYGKHYLFCPICGSQSLSSYEGEENAMAKYSGVKIGEGGRTAPCPICGNEEHVEGATFCMICGKPAVNQCTVAISQYGNNDQCDHTEPLPGNARYCPYCGSETTFLKEGLLKVWNGSQVPAVVENQALCDDDGSDLPF